MDNNQRGNRLNKMIMNVKVTSRSLGYVALAMVCVSFAGCKLLGIGGKNGGDQGELVGVGNREGWVMTIPYGMVPIPAGTFHMGQADEDPASTQTIAKAT